MNDCIVYHEFTHAFVSQVAPDLASYFWVFV